MDVVNVFLLTDVAFTVKDEVESQDEGFDSDQDDSDEGESVGDKDDLSDAGMCKVTQHTFK